MYMRFSYSFGKPTHMILVCLSLPIDSIMKWCLFKTYISTNSIIPSMLFTLDSSSIIQESFNNSNVLESFLIIDISTNYGFDLFIFTNISHHKVMLVVDVFLNNHHYSILMIHTWWLNYYTEKFQHSYLLRKPTHMILICSSSLTSAIVKW